MKYETILVKKGKNVATITMNRPDAMNALSPTMGADIESAIQDFAQDDEVRAVVITGAGRAFSAGGDLKTMQKKMTAKEALVRIDRITGFVKAMLDLPKPIIAAVNGHAVGAGCNIALASDIVIASEKAIFGELFARVGLMPDCGGIFLLPRQVGLTKAKELVFTAKTITAQEAERIGLINRVVPAEALEEESRKLAEELAGMPTLAIGTAKRLLNQSFESSFQALLLAENNAQTLLRATEDHEEGVRAFVEKRKPVFKGK
jgi:2-(1,2-epoxy-1,2-dihydrophenyl)acetyl-CoA isomerase